jgi:hypothetical protein
MIFPGDFLMIFSGWFLKDFFGEFHDLYVSPILAKASVTRSARSKGERESTGGSLLV